MWGALGSSAIVLDFSVKKLWGKKLDMELEKWDFHLSSADFSEFCRTQHGPGEFLIMLNVSFTLGWDIQTSPVLDCILYADGCQKYILQAPSYVTNSTIYKQLKLNPHYEGGRYCHLYFTDAESDAMTLPNTTGIVSCNLLLSYYYNS